MSYTVIKKVNGNGDVEDVREFSNSWGGHAFIWAELFDRYIKDSQIPYDNWMTDEGKRLWAAWEDEKIPEWIRLVHGATFDNVIVEFNKLDEIAKHYRKFADLFAKPDHVCHLNEWANICESLFNKETEESCKGVCFYGTSVSEDPWEDYDEETEEYSPYNINNGARHWFLFKEFYS